LRSVFDNPPQECVIKEIFVEVLLCRKQYHPVKTCPGKIDLKQAFLGDNWAPNSSRPRNVGPDPDRRAKIIQIHPHLIPGVGIRQTLVCTLFRETEELSRNFNSSGVFRAVERMRLRLKFTFCVFRSSGKMDFAVS
jgi:hypothetical protein